MWYSTVWCIVTLTLSMLAGPLSARAQQARKVARIGILCSVRCEGPSYDTLREGLRELGWIEGQSLVVDVRGAEGQRERLPALAADLVSLKVDLIVAVAPEPNRAAKNATSTIPIVMIGVADPVAVGLVESLARPGGITAKSLELLKASVPLNKACFSASEAPAAIRLKAFHRLTQPVPIFSTGKLLSNMQRSGPKSSMHVSI